MSAPVPGGAGEGAAPTGVGLLVIVVGASGTGKDSLLAAARDAFADDPGVHFVKRTVTRPPGDAHEPHESVTAEEFERRSARGDFTVEWAAHGLRYGVPASALEAVRAGRLVVLNGSRAALPRIRAAFPRREVCHVTVERDVLERRLRARGREDGAAIERRLARRIDPAAFVDPVWTLDNGGALAEAAARFVDRLRSLR